VGAKCDGKSFLPVLTDQPYESRKVKYIEYGAARAVRTDRWKYIAVRDVKNYPATREKAYDGQTDLLFDLQADPDEKQHLFKDPAHANAVKEMQDLLRALFHVRISVWRIRRRGQIAGIGQARCTVLRNNLRRIIGFVFGSVRYVYRIRSPRRKNGGKAGWP